MTDSREAGLKPHELIAADEYWPHPMTNLHRRPSFLSSPIRTAFDKASIRPIAELVMDMSGGVHVQDIPEGETLPVPEDNSRQVLKVVMDDRRIKKVGIKMSGQKKLDKFDEVADAMVNETLFSGVNIVGNIPYRRISTAEISRRVFYARRHKSGLLAGYLSSSFFDIAQDDRYFGFGLILIPKVKVGEVYYHNMWDDLLRKVVKASILEPMGNVRPNSRRRKRIKKANEDEDELWLPAPKPQLNN